MRTVYGAFDPATARAEAAGTRARFGLPQRTTGLPKTFFEMELDLSLVIDLTDGAVRKASGLSVAAMKAPWRDDATLVTGSRTQVLGHQAKAAGVEAMVVPSTQRPSGKNVVLFPENVILPSRVSVINGGWLH